MHVYWWLPALIVLFAVSLILIHRLEKRMVWPFSDPAPTPPFTEFRDYAPRWVDDAVGSGFTLLGWTRDLKSSLYRVNYALLVSPERDIFAVVGEGALASLPLRATWLYTPTMDGRVFYSADNQSAISIDPSRNWVNQLAQASSFSQLVLSHREWLRSSAVLSRSLSRGRELEEFRSVREQHFRSMERSGLIRYTDPNATHFHYTLAGAARTALLGYFLGIARRLSGNRFPRTA